LVVDDIGRLTTFSRYNENTFAQDAEKLGIARGSVLSRKEWNAVRRRMSTKPRLFSKKFISSQLSKRNNYRNLVRALHANPSLAKSINFPYDVCAPIRVGATVNAYNKTYRIIQRGTVMTYDHETALYLILFESKQFGYELCPDTDVASCGPPNLVYRAPTLTIRGNVFIDEFVSSTYGCRLSSYPGKLGSDTIYVTKGFLTRFRSHPRRIISHLD
jgi:DIRP